MIKKYPSYLFIHGLYTLSSTGRLMSLHKILIHKDIAALTELVHCQTLCVQGTPQRDQGPSACLNDLVIVSTQTLVKDDL